MKKRLTLSAGMVVLVLVMACGRTVKTEQVSAVPVVANSQHWQCSIGTIEESAEERKAWVKCPDYHGFYLEVGRDVHVGQWVSVDIAISPEVVQ